MPEEKKQENQDQKTSALDNIYQTEEKQEKNDYFSTFEKSGKTAKWQKRLIILFIILIILAGASVLGFLTFGFNKKFAGQSVKIEFEGPQSVSSGDSFSFTVLYKNNEPVALKNSELTLNFPAGFSFEQSSPAPDNEFNNSWNLKNIPPEGSGKILIKGRIVSENNSSKIVSAKLNFEPENFSSPFDIEKDYIFKINESALKISLDFPSRSAVGAEFKGKIALSNASEKTINDIKLEIFFPSDFAIKKMEPPAQNTLWEINELQKDKQFEINIEGALSGNNGDFKEIKARASLRNDKNEFIAQTEKNLLVSIINPNLEAQILTNDKAGGISVDWGDSLTVLLKIKNAGDQIIRDAAGRIVIDSTVIDWQNVRWTVPGKIINSKIANQKTLIWTKEEFPDLLELSPGKETVLSVTLPVIKRPPKNVSVKDLIIAINGQTGSKNIVDLEGVEITSKAETVEARVTTQVQLRPEARYTDDEYQPLGSGPIPPEAGKTTTYQIQWYLSNASNEVTDAKITTILPKNVFWKGGEVSSGTLSFNPATREVSWSINRVPARSGLDLPGLLASFNVSITPAESDIGTSLILTEQTSLEALDNFTDQIIQKKFDVLTTDIQTDPKYAGQGKVVAMSDANSLNDNANSNTNQNTQ